MERGTARLGAGRTAPGPAGRPRPNERRARGGRTCHCARQVLRRKGSIQGRHSAWQRRFTLQGAGAGGGVAVACTFGGSPRVLWGQPRRCRPASTPERQGPTPLACRQTQEAPRRTTARSRSASRARGPAAPGARAPPPEPPPPPPSAAAAAGWARGRSRPGPPGRAPTARRLRRVAGAVGRCFWGGPAALGIPAQGARARMRAAAAAASPARRRPPVR